MFLTWSVRLPNNGRPGTVPTLCRSIAFSSVSNSTANDEWLISSGKPERCKILAGDISADAGRMVVGGGARLGEYVTSDKTLYNPCNKLPTQVSKRGPDEQNFIKSKLFPVQQNLRKPLFKISTWLMADLTSQHCIVRADKLLYCYQLDHAAGTWRWPLTPL